MKSQIIALAFAITGLSTAAQAADIVCSTPVNQNRASASITIGQNADGQPTIQLYAQGGIAHFVSVDGPFVATRQQEPDGAVYTAQDSFGQTIVVSVMTTGFGGKLVTMASTDFGLWQNQSFTCH